MKTLKDWVLESRIKVDPNVDQVTFVEKSPEFYDGRDEFLNIVKGGKALMYHGTNVDFDKFDIKKGKKERNASFFGDGLFFTADEFTAWKYAGAQANNTLDKSIIERAKKVDKDVYKFMLALYKDGLKAWEDFREKYPKLYETDEFNGVTADDMAEIVAIIPDSQLAKDYAKRDGEQRETGLNMFATSSSALDSWIVKYIKDLGLGDFRERVLDVVIDAKDAEVFITKSQAQAKKSKADIIIVYAHKELVDGKPEVIVKDPKRLKIFNKEYAEYDNI